MKANHNSFNFDPMHHNMAQDVSKDDSEYWIDPVTDKMCREPIIPKGLGPIPEYAQLWREIDDWAPLKGSIAVLPTGIMSLRLRDSIRIDMTLDRAVRVFNKKKNILLAISKMGDAAALMHPNGRVYQYGSRVEILAHDLNQGNHKFAKMWHEGVSFTSEECVQTYLVDSKGTLQINDTFLDLSKNFALGVFFTNACFGDECIPEAMNLIEKAQYWTCEKGAENWIINNIRITQAADGLLRVGRSSNKYQLRTSPLNGTASLTTPYVHTTASLGATSHLFVRRGERRMHFDGGSFIVRNAGHSAGFDDKNQLKVY